MSVYKNYIENLTVDKSFKDDLLSKMRAKAAEETSGETTFVGGEQTERVQRRKQRPKRRRIALNAALSAACAAALCLVVIPVAVAVQPAGSEDPNYSDNAGGSPQQAAAFGLGERAEDRYGNFIQFNDVSCSGEIILDGVKYMPAEGNVLVVLSVELDLTYEKQYGGYISLNQDNIQCAYYIDGIEGNYYDNLMFRQDIFDEHFPKENDNAAGKGALVFETGEQFINYLAEAGQTDYGQAENTILFECGDFRTDGQQGMILTTFHLSLTKLIEENIKQ